MSTIFIIYNSSYYCPSDVRMVIYQFFSCSRGAAHFIKLVVHNFAIYPQV